MPGLIVAVRGAIIYGTANALSMQIMGGTAMFKIVTNLLNGVPGTRRLIATRSLTDGRDRGVGHADFMSETFNE